MGKAFGESAGGAKKNNLDYMTFVEGQNKMRIVGEILPRYAYWRQLKTDNGKHMIPVECLSFDREREEFTNIEKDWYKHFFPKIESGQNAGKDVFPQWSYVGTVIDPKDGKLKMVGFKKKLFEQIQLMAKKPAYGDPTDPVTGWDVVFNKNKTGSHAFNVEYVLDQLECKVRPLTDAEKVELDENLKPIDELVPRQTPEMQKAFIETAWLGKDKEEPNTDEEAAKAAVGDDFDDDIPF